MEVAEAGRGQWMGVDCHPPKRLREAPDNKTGKRSEKLHWEGKASTSVNGNFTSDTPLNDGAGGGLRRVDVTPPK